MRFVKPKTFLIGCTGLDYPSLYEYLEYTGNESFISDMAEAHASGISDLEILSSFCAKVCYKSLTEGKNANVTKIRSIENNVKATINSGHGSVFEHCQLNFITTDCSRVFTHELVRHRVGTAYSQTSGRYVAIDNIDLVLDPILDPVKEEIEDCIKYIEAVAKKIRTKLGVDYQSFEMKKKLTSAIRRIAPNGQSNEIAWSANIRALRHMLEMRTSEHAEWEIRYIFNQVAHIIYEKFPGILYTELGSNESEADRDSNGLYALKGLRI